MTTAAGSDGAAAFAMPAGAEIALDVITRNAGSSNRRLIAESVASHVSQRL